MRNTCRTLPNPSIALILPINARPAVTVLVLVLVCIFAVLLPRPMAAHWQLAAVKWKEPLLLSGYRYFVTQKIITTAARINE